jgi:oxygen-dependent protoporphyrinogen oxidase
VTLRRGMQTLIEALANALPVGAQRLEVPVQRVERNPHGGWTLAMTDHAEPESFDGVIFAASAQRTAILAEQFDPQLSGLLRRIEYASSVVVTLEYQRDQVAHPLDGFGAVVPVIENRPFIAVSFPTVKFPHTAPPGRTVLRVFMGGVLHPELVDRSDAQLIEMAKSELVDLLGTQGEPAEVHVVRWRDSMPQYHVGHLGLVASIESRAARHSGLQLAGSGYRGVGIPQCVRSGREAAERLAAQLQPQPRRSAAPI